MPVLVLCGAPAAGMPGAPSRMVDPTTPIASATDLGLTRGDGVFETVGVHDGRMHDLEPHLERLAQSAAMLDMPKPDLGVFREAISWAVRELLHGLDEVPATALCKVVYTRGTETAAAEIPGGRPLGFAYADVFPDVSADRHEGVPVITLSRGYPKGVGAQAPWLLAGAKTLSYAINMAALRHAKARGAKDVILTTTDGFVLEAPRSTVLVRHGGMIVTPAIDGGLLHGTAQRAAFDAFEDRGFTCDYRDVTVEQLTSADAVWLTDSVQLLRPVRTLDGTELAVDQELTGAVNAHMLAAH
ncbi:aminotransferase class IV [Demequina lignilytica]|uniref:Aminotransferase class IV n=1 Tax=Demequina lignilytica TaxID=3051663 RepID=A0AB35MIX5_9MICO|nr:aminotransferase class IV [Demequina sp. SYSU T0a273]MDN4483762.1 aminotransferase class IV [Demequina sp. SYSU T0a273]